MHVEAHGMTQIRQIFPQKARQVDEALDLATTYAWNSFRNLQLLKTSDGTVTPVHRLIMDFIDVPAVTDAHVEKLEKVLGDIFAALLEPTLRKPNSRRFVVGKLLDNAEYSFGFTLPKDINRKIYLAEKFLLSQFRLLPRTSIRRRLPHQYSCPGGNPDPRGFAHCMQHRRHFLSRFQQTVRRPDRNGQYFRH